jgi:hypothetical protein
MSRNRCLFLMLSVMVSHCSGSATLHLNYTPSASVTKDCIHMTQGTRYLVSGYARYEQPQLKNTAVYLDLMNPSLSLKPIRQALVQAIDVAANRVIAWGTTGSDGSYSLRYDEPEGATIRVRVLARIYANAQNDRYRSDDPCNLFLSVLDNTQGAALYAVSSAEIAGGKPNADVLAPYNNSTRPGAPFSVLDTALLAAETILAAKADIVFKPLNLYWSTGNTNAAGEVKNGLIGTSYFGQDVFNAAGRGAIYLLGAANIDTDEYDANVIAHEFGHYLEYAVYRSDSVGGAHSLTARVDPALAFSEAWGNFFSAAMRQNSLYTDSNGSNNASGLWFDLETNSALNIYNEAAVQGALWDLHDTASDAGETAACALPIFSNAFLALKNDAAAASYLSFATALQNAAPACAMAGLATIHANMGTGTITNSYTPASQPAAACRTAVYATASLPAYTDAGTLDLSFSSGGINNYCAIKWYRVTGNGTTRSIALSGVTGSCNLDLYLTQGGSVVASSRNPAMGANEALTATLQNSMDYVIRIHTVSPATGICNYTLNIT